MEDGTTTTATYSYNADGQRIKKVVGSTTTNYYYNGDILAGMTIGLNKLIFMYDESGTPFGFTYNGTAYYYVKNLQGDVIAITNASGTVVVEYAYDAWGKLLSVSGTAASTIGEANPIRYRGYVYDSETGYYYLNSRYYSPDLCRFISADSYVSTGQGVLGYNMFAYCLNNPSNKKDINGFISEKAAEEKIKENADAINAAGEEFDVDPAVIAICIYTEQILNVNFLDTLTDIPCFFLDTSIGLGQVKISTAEMLQDLEYIERAEDKTLFGFSTSGKFSTALSLTDDSYNIRCVAAYLAYWQDMWQSTLDISNRPEILATLYNLGVNANKPNLTPKPNSFGKTAAHNYFKVKAMLF